MLVYMKVGQGREQDPVASLVVYLEWQTGYRVLHCLFRDQNIAKRTKFKQKMSTCPRQKLKPYAACIILRLSIRERMKKHEKN